MEVRISADAAADIERIDTWWRENRPAAPELFMQELAEILALLAGSPDAGEVFRRVRGRVTRRTLMEKTRHYAHHRLEDDGAVMILAIWGNPRRRGPPLKRR